MQRRAIPVLLFILCTALLRAQSALADSESPIPLLAVNDGISEHASDPSPGNGGGAAPILPAPPPREDFTWSKISEQRRVNWGRLMQQSMTFLALQHTFRIMTEPGTREGMQGPFFKNYWRSVSAIHGWDDGDPFYVNYVGHPMQGAVAGFIFAQNDVPAYRYAEFGKSRDYWQSRLRATAFSLAYSMQFEVGVASEASIGRIQAKRPQQGLVDHVITPAFGMGWMVAEDAIDKYLVRKFEDRFGNRFAVAMVRSWLNPARSMGNIVKGAVPWNREARPNPYGNDAVGRRTMALLEAAKRQGPLPSESVDRPDMVLAPFEASFAFQTTAFQGSVNGQCPGGAVVGGIRLAERWQAVFDIGGCDTGSMDNNRSGDSLHYLAGVRWTPWASGKWSLSTQVLGGGEKITHEQKFPEKKALAYEAWRKSGADPKKTPEEESYTATTYVAGASLQGGAGLSYRVNGPFKIQIADLSYRRSWLPSLNGSDYGRSLTLSAGVVLRMGSW